MVQARKIFSGLISGLLISLLVSGCGFKLKGTYDLSSHIETMALVSQDSGVFEQRLIRTFGYRGIELVTDSDAPEYALVILEKRESQRSLSSEQIEIRFEVSYLVNDRDQNNIMGKRPLLTDRQVRFSTSQPGDKERTLDEAREDMYDEIILRLYTQLSVLEFDK